MKNNVENKKWDIQNLIADLDEYEKLCVYDFLLHLKENRKEHVEKND